MNYFAIEYANHTTIVVKTDLDIDGVVISLMKCAGLRHSSGGVYNGKSFQVVRPVPAPDDRQKFVAQNLKDALI